MAHRDHRGMTTVRPQPRILPRTPQLDSAFVKVEAEGRHADAAELDIDIRAFGQFGDVLQWLALRSRTAYQQVSCFQ